MGERHNPIQILIADRDRLVRCGIARLVDSFSGMCVAAEAADADELLSAASTRTIHVALVDAGIACLRAPEMPRELRSISPGTELVILSKHESKDCLQRAIDAGASGYVPKNAAVGDLEAALLGAANGGRSFSAADSRPNSGTGQSPAPRLTPRQHEVLKLIVDGHRSKDIADLLGVSIKTVETHRADIMRRLGVRHMASLVREALRLGLLSIY